MILLIFVFGWICSVVAMPAVQPYQQETILDVPRKTAIVLLNLLNQGLQSYLVQTSTEAPVPVGNLRFESEEIVDILTESKNVAEEKKIEITKAPPNTNPTSTSPSPSASPRVTTKMPRPEKAESGYTSTSTSTTTFSETVAEVDVDVITTESDDERDDNLFRIFETNEKRKITGRL